MPQRKYSQADYLTLTSVDCADVAVALGLQLDESNRTTRKAIHIKDSGGLFLFPDKNNWYRHSDGAKGFAVDLVTDILGCDRDYALDFIANNVVHGISRQETLSSYHHRTQQREADESKEFVVPPHDIKPNRVFAYLIKTRGIDSDIVKAMVVQKLIAEDRVHHNCLFFGKDTDGNIRSCAVRGTATGKRFRGEVRNGDKSISFAMRGKNNILRLFESPIDAMSHATFSKLLGKDWTMDHRLSTNGCGYDSVLHYLSQNENIDTVWLLFDNDEGGRKADAAIETKLRRDFPDRALTIKVAHPPQNYKDWNEALQDFRFRCQAQTGIAVEDFLKSPSPRRIEVAEADEDEDDEDYELEM